MVRSFMLASVSVRGVGDFATDELANHTELDLTNRPYLKFEYKDAENISLTWEQVNRLVDHNLLYMKDRSLETGAKGIGLLSVRTLGQ